MIPSLGSARRIATSAGGAFATFYIFYTSAPLTLTADGPSPGYRVGIVMLIVIAVQPLTPLLGRWITSRQPIVGGSIASMGVGSWLMPFAGHWPGMVLLGSGFGIFVVASTAWVKETAPPEALAIALGTYGFGSVLGGAIGAPLGLYIAQTIGAPASAIAGGFIALASILPTRHRRSMACAGRGAAPAKDKRAWTPRSRTCGLGDLIGLAAHLLAVTIYAIALTGLSIANDEQPTWLPVLTAFAIQGGLAIGRVAGGWASNRWAPSKVLIYGLIMLALWATGFAHGSTLPALKVAVSIIIGLSAGACQTAALTALMNRADTTAAINRASTAWNICFDLGLGLGALAASSTTAL